MAGDLTRVLAMAVLAAAGLAGCGGGASSTDLADADRRSPSTMPTAAASPSAEAEACPAAPERMLSAVAQQPADGVVSLDLPDGVLVPLSAGGAVLVARVDVADEEGVRDQVLARWFVDGPQVLTYDEIAAEVTDWAPGSFVEVRTADTMAVEYCAEVLGVADARDEPKGECSRAPDDLLARIASKPRGAGPLVLPSGYQLEGERGYVVGGFLSSADASGDVDGAFGTWFVDYDGTIYAYTDAALGLTNWPQAGDGSDTDRTRRVRACAESNAG